MCDPVTALAVASTASGIYAQDRQASAQKKALNASTAQTQKQLQLQSDSEAGNRVKAGRAERARMAVAAGESGVSGNSFEALISDSLFQQAEDITSISNQGTLNAEGASAQAQQQNANINYVNPISAGLQIADTGYTTRRKVTKGS